MMLTGLSEKHLFLTGGTGFFGKWLLAALDALNGRGIRVSVDVLSRNPAGFLAAEPTYQEKSWLRMIQGDVTALLPGNIHYDYVIHAATDTSVAAQKDKYQLFEQILNGGRRILDFAAAGGAQRILFTGSGAQYGRLPDDTHSFSEDCGFACNANSVDSAYGEAKRALETLAMLHATRSGVEPIFTRCFAFAGPGLPMDGHFAIGNFIRDALYQPEISVKARGEVWRSYLYGADLAIWLLTFLLRGQAGQAYNVGSNEFVTLHELARRVGGLLSPGKPVLRPFAEDGGNRSRYLPNIERALTMGLAPWTDLDMAIVNTATWSRDIFKG
ncbi:NAD(P)-dependent oxidoreductase [Chitinimonas naiadis]